MIATDASVVVDALVDTGLSGQRAHKALASDPSWVAPPHFHLEVTSAVLRLMQSAVISVADADRAIAGLVALRVRLVEPALLLGRVWDLRDNLTPYDAAYVAVAEVAQCRLLTTDRRLAAAPGIRCDVTVL